MPTPPLEQLLQFERSLWKKGFRRVAGIDEAGRGPLAGPVVAACALFEEGAGIEGVYDSKAVSPKKREKLYDLITSQAVSWAIGIVEAPVIDKINIYQATMLAMRQAVDGLTVPPDFLLIDAMPLKTDIPSNPIIKGDQKSFAVAAASIIAKVTRDRIMNDLHTKYPEFGWNRNKGYGTAEHYAALEAYGYTPQHRQSFNLSSDGR
jgi:ribonuclease HII